MVTMRLNFSRLNSTISKHLITQGKYKECMGRIANQAMILSSASQNNVPHKSFRGLTLSSVTSLALKPFPMIQFNLQLPSFTSESLHENRYFAVHLLRPNPTSIKLAKIFSKGAIKNAEDSTFSPTTPFEDLAEHEHYETYKLEGTKLVIPILRNSERVLICQKKDTFRVGDHEIWVGQVDDILVNYGHVTGGLLYCSRNFHILGDKLE